MLFAIRSILTPKRQGKWFGMNKSNPKCFILGDNLKLYKSTARVRFVYSKKQRIKRKTPFQKTVFFNIKIIINWSIYAFCDPEHFNASLNYASIMRTLYTPSIASSSSLSPAGTLSTSIMV